MAAIAGVGTAASASLSVGVVSIATVPANGAGRSADSQISAGASLVQIYSGFIYKGPALIRESVDAIAAMGR